MAPPADPPADAALPPGDDGASPTTPAAAARVPGMEWVARDAGDRLDLPPSAHDAHDGLPEPDTSPYRQPGRGSLEDAVLIRPPELRRLRPVDEDASGQPGPDTSAFHRRGARQLDDVVACIPPGLRRLRPVDEDATGQPGPDTSAYARPNPPGMEELLRVLPADLGRLRPVDEEIEGAGGPDTSAYGRPSAPDPDEERALLAPRVAARTGSNLEALLDVPVLEVTPAMRAAWRAEQAELPAPPRPAGPPALPRYVLGSAPGPGQVCPRCGGALRVVREAHEERLDAAWFRFEWLSIHRGLADCPQHAEVETAPLQRPAFLVGRGVGNGLLAWVATWRWQDHAPGHEVARMLTALGLRTPPDRVGRWLVEAHAVIAPIAAAVRAEVEGPEDERGVRLDDGARTGRLRGRRGARGVALRWTEEEATAGPDQPGEVARDCFLALRGWSRAGRQAALRRSLAQVAAADPARGQRLAWLGEELRRAGDAAAEDATLDALTAALAEAVGHHPTLRGPLAELRAGAEELRRYDARGRPLAALPLPEHVRHRLPTWTAPLGEGGAEALADWLTLTESCAALAMPAWAYLRDLCTAAAEADGPLPAARWTPAARR